MHIVHKFRQNYFNYLKKHLNDQATGLSVNIDLLSNHKDRVLTNALGEIHVQIHQEIQTFETTKLHSNIAPIL